VVQGLPSWAGFDTANGRLRGIPGAGDARTYPGITITVSDGQYSAELQAFSVTVLGQVSGTATISWTPPTKNVDGSPITDLAGFRVVYGQSPDALSQDVTIASPQITTAVVENLSAGTWYFGVKADTTADVESDLSAVVQRTIN